MTTATRSEKLDLRLTPETKQTLHAAAASQSRSLSEFVLETVIAMPPFVPLASPSMLL